MGRIRIAAVIALAVILAPAATQAADLDQLKRDYEAAKKVVGANDPIAGYRIDGTPQIKRALESEWTIVADWLAVNSVSNERLNDKQINNTLRRLDPDYSANALNLTPETYVIGIQRYGFGTFIVVRRIGERWNVVWNVRQVTSTDTSRIPGVLAWQPVGATTACKGRETKGTWDQCGPISSDGFGLLPKDASGHARFYVDGWYAQSAGETEGFQLSVWAWDGQRAIPQFAKVFLQMIEVEHTPRLKGDVLLVQTKEDFQNFFSCGSCVGRQADWSLRITPTGVQDLGNKSHMPEVDVIDHLIGRIAHDEPTTDHAAPAVVEALKPVVESQKDESHKIDPKWFSLGMIGNGEAETNPTNPHESLVCFSSDADNDRRIFTLEHRGTGFYISKMRDIGEGDTPDKLCTKPND